MVRAVRAELDRCEALGSIEGMVALRLALTLDDSGLGAAQVSTISQQLLRTMEPIRRRAPRVPDKLDELSARIALKAAAAAS
jgi:hypothetical protein